MNVYTSKSTRAVARLAALCSLGVLAGCGVVGSLAESLRHPAKPFERTPEPTAPDYAQARASRGNGFSGPKRAGTLDAPWFFRHR